MAAKQHARGLGVRSWSDLEAPPGHGIREAEASYLSLEGLARARILPIVEKANRQYLGKRGELTVGLADGACSIELCWGRGSSGDWWGWETWGERLVVQVSNGEYRLLRGNQGKPLAVVAVADPAWRDKIERYVAESLESNVCHWRETISKTSAVSNV